MSLVFSSTAAINIGWGLLAGSGHKMLDEALSDASFRRSVAKSAADHAPHFNVKVDRRELARLLKDIDFGLLVASHPAQDQDSGFAEYFPAVTPAQATLLGEACQAAYLQQVLEQSSPELRHLVTGQISMLKGQAELTEIGLATINYVTDIFDRLNESVPRPEFRLFGDPTPPLPHFAAAPRQPQLDSLDQMLAQAGQAANTVALTGPGGFGKSQVAAWWWRNNEGDYDRVAWVKADNDPTGPYAEICREFGLDLTDPVRSVRQLINNSNETWLFVLDNVNDPNDLADFLPSGSICDVLITSRAVDGWENAGAITVPVEEFEERAAVDLLRTIARDVDLSDEDAALVARRLGCVPLALALAAAFINERRFTARKYLDFCDQRGFPLLDPKDNMGYGRGIAAIWQASLEAASEHDRRTPDAFKILALVDWTAIDRSSLFEILETVLGLDELEADDALVMLARYGLGRHPNCDMSIVHVLLAEGVHRKDESTNKSEDEARVYCAAILASTLAFRHIRRMLVDHEHIMDSDLVDTMLLWSSEQLDSRLPDIEYHKVLATCAERIHGPDHSITLACRGNLASSYRSAGHLDEAITAKEQVLEDRTRMSSWDHPETLESRNDLAVSYQEAGRTSEATEMKELVLDARERLLGHYHPDTLRSRSNLAFSYWSAGRVGEAIALEAQVLDDRERLLGHHHPDTLRTRSNLATSYWSAGRVDEAIGLQSQVLDDRERLLGHEHPDTLRVRSNLATSYASAGRVDEAIALQSQVLDDRERLLGHHHPDTLRSRSKLSLAYQQAGRLSEAIGLAGRVLAERARSLGLDHPDTVKSRQFLDIMRADQLSN